MRKGLVLVVVLLCVAGLMAAMAYNTATVRSDSTLTVASSDVALLSVIPGDHEKVGNKDYTANVREDGVVEFIFGRGLDGNDFGLQPGSAYQWNDLFHLKNNSNEKLEVCFEVEAPVREYITIRKTTRSPGMVFTRNQWKNNNGLGATFIMEPGSIHKFELRANLPLDTDPTPGQRASQPDLGVLNGQIKVHAKAVE